MSAGRFAGVRVIQSLLPVMRESGLVNIFWDINIGNVGKVFADDGRLLDDAFIRRSAKFILELIWMSKVLRHGREQATIDEEAAEVVPCPDCGAPMMHHADKVAPSEAAEMMVSMHACPACGQMQSR